MPGGRCALQVGQGGEPAGPFAGGPSADGQVLQGRGRLEQAGRGGPAELGPQPGGEQGRVPQGTGGVGCGWGVRGR